VEIRSCAGATWEARRVSEIWDNAAPGWEANADFVDRHLAGATDLLLGALGVGPGGRVIDLACGPGGTGLAAAEVVGPGGRVVPADVAPAMVEIAARRAAGMAQVETIVCDQAAIEAPEASFDVALARHGLMFAEVPTAAVAEAGRVLRPGGRYGAITWGPREANPWLGIILDSVGEQFGVTFPPPGIAGPFSLDQPEKLAGALGRGGLEEVEVQELATPMWSASVEDWWERVPRLAGPLAQALAGMEDEVRSAIRERALGRASDVARTVDGGIELDGSVLIGWGRCPT
jgi:SAM-dependent methyltransferase